MTASVDLGPNTSILASGTVSISAEADGFATLFNLGFISFAAGYAQSEADATIDISPGVEILASGDVSIGSTTKNTTASKSLNLAIADPLGADLVANVVLASSTSKTLIEAGADITSTLGNVTVSANATKNISSSAEGGAGSDGLALVVAVSLVNTTADAFVYGTIHAALDASVTRISGPLPIRRPPAPLSAIASSSRSSIPSRQQPLVSARSATL